MIDKMIAKKVGTFESFDGTRIYFEVRGKGPTLVFAYGIGCLTNHWRHQLKYFSPHFQTVVFDYRGHHASQIPSDVTSMTVDSLARDLLLLQKHLGVEKIHAIGHSFGAQVLLRAYDMDSSGFQSLCFINGFASNPIKGMFGNELASQAFEVWRGGHRLLPETSTFLWRWAVSHPLAVRASALLGGFNLQLTHRKDIEIYARGVSSLNLDVFLRLFESMMRYDGAPVLEKINVPTLLIGGKADSVTPQKHQETMRKLIKNCDFLMVPFGSHCTQLDMPDLVNLRLETFLKN